MSKPAFNSPAADSAPTAPTTPRALIAVGLLLVPPLAVAISWMLQRDTLPTQLPAHWSGTGAPDRLQATVETFWLAFGISAATAVGGIIAIAWLVRQRAISQRVSSASSASSARSLVWMGTLLAGTLSSTFAFTWFGSVWTTQLADGDPSQAVLGWGLLLIVPVLAYGLLPMLVLGRFSSRGSEGDRRQTLGLDLAAHETAAWNRTVSFHIFTWAAVLCLAVSALITWLLTIDDEISLMHEPSALIGVLLPAVLGLFLLALVRIRVTVDARGLAVRSAVIGIPLRRIPLAQMRNIEASVLEPAQWGGWGWRIFPGGSALIAGHRPGIAITLTDGRRFGVTVPDAETAASLLVALHERSA